MTRVQWPAYVIPGGAVVDVIADDQTTTPTMSIESPSDLPGGGSEQTIRLIGPVAIAWNDAAIEDIPGIKVADLAAGTLVLRTFTVATTSWEGIVAGEFVFSIGDQDGSPRLDTEAWNVAGNTVTGGGMTLVASGGVAVNNGTEQTTVLRVGGGPTAIYVRLTYDSGTPSAGTANVYALTAEPAAP